MEAGAYWDSGTTEDTVVTKEESPFVPPELSAYLDAGAGLIFKLLLSLSWKVQAAST